MTWMRGRLDEAEWYFREDPVANAHHSEWHRGSEGTRRGEHFYYMHGQMLARYEAERLSLDLGLTRYFTPDQWGRRISDSYDPRLGSDWTRRSPGYISTRKMNNLRETVESMARYNGRYSDGEDLGIDRFGRIFEGGLHNTGHIEINELSAGSNGVMGSTVGGMRDPIFYRWHGYVDSMFRQYKNRLTDSAPYSDEDLGFPGVRVVSAVVQSQGGVPNTFYTYSELSSVRLNSLSSTSPGSRMTVQYMRMNHRPFQWNIVIDSELSNQVPAIVRIFMMPVGQEAANRATIHMDHFHVFLEPGTNEVTRMELEAPHLSKSRWSLRELQDNLMNGQVNCGDFSWGGCGWPRHLNIPRGTGEGMDWTLVVMVSRVLPQDRGSLREWERNRELAWSYCGVRRGLVPDSRPLGFPVDRDFGVIDRLAGGRENWDISQVTIVHGES